MKPMGWKDIRVPSNAPTSETRPPKDWNCASDYVGDEADGDGAAKPGGPVDHGVGCEVFGAAEDSDEDVFGRDLNIWSAKVRQQTGWRALM